MTAALDIRNPYRRSDGHVGARTVLQIEHADGWHQQYAFDTHGMTSSQVAARASAIEEYHDAKAARLTGFRSVQGIEFLVNGDTFRVVDCTILDAGVTLYLDARRIAEDGAAQNVRGFPVRRSYHDIAAVPPNEEILLTMIRMLIADYATLDVATAHAEFVAKVAARRG